MLVASETAIMPFNCKLLKIQCFFLKKVLFYLFAEDIEILLRLNTRALPTFSAALILIPAMAIFIAAYLLAITIKWEIGLSLGIIGLFGQFFFLREF